MKSKALVLGLVVGCFACLAVPALTQEQDAVRGAFLTTRPKPVDKSAKGNESAKPNRRRPKTSTTKGSSGSATLTTSVGTTDTKPRVTTQKLGLGLTLFTRDSLGLAVRVDPARTFLRGDRVRVLLETNADGYLYIFNTTNGGKPVMIYPNRELDEGGNYLRSHIPFEIPASTASEERLRWLVFDEHPGTERLYFVFTREPLKGIPLEDELIAFCGEPGNSCPIQPNSELWTQIEKEIDAPLQIASTAKYGKGQTDTERQAIERGLGLSKDEPEPSLILMSASANSGTLVTVLDLVHK